MSFFRTSVSLMALSNATQIPTTFNPLKINPLRFPSSHVSFLSPSHTISNSLTAAANNMSRLNSADFELSTITALSPLDGRYREKVKDLAPIMGEYGLNYYRVIVEVHPFLFFYFFYTLLFKPPFFIILVIYVLCLYCLD